MKEAAKFVRDLKSLAKEADESLAKHKALELEIEHLLRAVVSQDIMSIMQDHSVLDTSNLQNELEHTKENHETSYNEKQQKIKWLQAQLGDQKGKSKDTPCVSNTLDPLSQKLENENVELEFQVLNYAKENAHHLKTNTKNLLLEVTTAQVNVTAVKQNTLRTTSTTLTARLPILNPGEYDIWLMRIEQYFFMTDYSLWEVIPNGNKVLKRTIREVEQEYEPSSIEETQDMRNEIKARGTLLIALPNKDQLKFHSYKDAKLLIEAIEKRYGGNKESKKVQRTLLKQQYEKFAGSSSKTMDQTFDRLQKIISQLEIQGEVITQEDMNLKLLRSLLSGWKTHASIWRNKKEIETISLDDFNNSNHITNEADNTAYGVSAAHTQSNPTSGDNLKQIDPDDLEEMDLQWEMAMLTIRARKFIQGIGRKLDVNGQRVGFDRTKVECYNCHKNGYFARKYRVPRNQENRGRENSRRTVTVETSIENALVAQDRIGGYNWSYQAEEEHLTNYALMAFTSSRSSSCSDSESQFNLVSYKAGLESVEARLAHYKKNEAVFEESINVLNLEVKLRDNALVENKKKLEKAEKERDELKLTLEKFQNSSKSLNNLLESQVCDKFKTGLGYNAASPAVESFVNSSEMLENQEYNKSKSDKGYHAVPPPYTGNFIPFKPDLTFMDEIVESENMDVITVVTPSNVKKVESNHESADVKNNGDAVEPKTVRKNSFRPPVIEDWNSDDDSEVEFIPNVEDKTVRPSTEKIKFVKSARETVEKVETPKQNKHYPRGNQRNWNNLMSQRLGSDFKMINKACFVCGSFEHLHYVCDKKVIRLAWTNSSRVNHKKFSNKITHPHPNRRFVPQAVLTGSGIINTAGASVNTAVRLVNTNGSKTTINHRRPILHAYKKGYSQVTRPFNKYSANKNSIINKKVNTIRVKDTTAGDRAVVSEHKGKGANAGNPQHKEYKEKEVIDNGCFRHMSGNKCYLTEYEDYDGSFVSFRDGKGRIFGKVLSSDFKLLDESHVLLRVPRKDNIYSVDLKSVVPTKGLTCLFAKATIDESNLWHRRLGQINFKNMNKLVRGNLVRGLPSKIFENVHSCVACQKGKQHKASCKAKLTGVAKRRNITLIEATRTMLVDSKLPTTFWAKLVNTACYVINRVLVIKPHNRTPYELIHGRTPLIDFMKPFGCPITILNTKDHLGKFDGKDDEGFFVGYSVISKAMRVFNKRTRIVEETLNIRFLKNTTNVTRNEPDWLFDVHSLTISMNYVPAVTGNQTNGIVGTRDNIVTGQAEKKTEHEQEYILIPFCTTDPSISEGLKDCEEDFRMKPTEMDENVPNVFSINDTGIFGNAYDDEDVGAEADLNNLKATMNISPIPTTRIENDHPKDQIIEDSYEKRFNFLVASIDKKELAIPGQTATGKEFLNPLMADSLPKTISAKLVLAGQKSSTELEAKVSTAGISLELQLLTKFLTSEALFEKPIIAPSSYQPKKTYKPRKAIRTTEISQSSRPINLVADETDYKEWEDRIKKASPTPPHTVFNLDAGAGQW
ncbi:ribonuclease H-like domain-containing protein [Tanacetum coccineum]